MAWDTERTKALLLASAMREFCDHGLAGARVDRIATEAGINKQRIYEYFGNKDGLFAAVLETQLATVVDAVPLRGEGIDAVVDYAGRCFDFHTADGTLARLSVWEGLERQEPAAREVRAERTAAKAARVQEMLPGLDEQDARQLLLTILTLCDGWAAMGTTGLIYAPLTDEQTAEGRRLSRRGAIQLTVRATCEALLARG